jgi:hypothetical protein
MAAILFKTLSGRKRGGMSIREAIRCLTLGEMLQGAAELAAVVIFLVATIIWIITWLKPHPDIHVGVAMYTSERGFTLEGTTKASLTRRQDLVSNCTLWQFPPMQHKHPEKVTDLHSWVLTKLLLENASDQGLTNLRMGVVTRLHNTSTELSATPNVEATGMVESTSQDGLHKYVISIASLGPHASAVLSLQTPMNDNLLRVLSQEHITVRLPAVFLSADQLWNFHPTVASFNASTMLKLETEMQTGERVTSLVEKIESKTLPPSDPDLLAEDASHQLLPTIPDCQVGAGGQLVEFVSTNQ